MAEPLALVLPPEPFPSLDAYLDAGGGRGLEHARYLKPAEVVEEVAASGVRGRGGAGFPTGTKWASVRAAGGTTWFVCNAAEGEPGTFKDRVLMARSPYAVVEGTCIALHALEAAGASIGTKARYTAEHARLEEAVEAAVDAGWPAADRITVVGGPDEYLFGEEKALLEVIEGKLPFPRILPPYEQGLHATMSSPNPTAVNNVETLCHVARIMADGAAAFREVGTVESPGTMVFTVTGDVATPGVWELPMGTPLRDLVCGLAGAEDPKAIVPGVSAAVLPATLLDLPLDFDSFREAGTGLGSGGFVVYGQHRDMVQVAWALERFLAVESCGQCNACKLGNLAIFDHLDRLVTGQGTGADIEGIRRRLENVTDQNRCYLPVGTQQVIGSILQEFPDEFTARIGSPSDPATAVPVPKLEHVGDGTAEVDPDYHRKRSDWSYAPDNA